MNYKNILIIKLSAIGDVIHALPVASALKKHNPESRITWIVEKPAYNLLTSNPNIDEVIVFDKEKYRSFTGLLKNAPELTRQLRNHEFDLAIDLQGLFKSAAISLLSGAKEKLVYCNAREFSHLVSKRVCGEYSEGHVIDRYLDVVRYLGVNIEKVCFEVNITQKEISEAKHIAASTGLDINKSYVVLAPGTNWPNKCWPASSFAALADKLFKTGIVPIVIGGPKDKILYQEIANKASVPIVDLVGKTGLKELAYIIKKARVFIGGDTGPMHLAVAVDTPVVALFGPTDPERNGPYGNHHRVIRISEDCAGCWRRKCPKGEACLEKISVEDVLCALNELIDW